MTTGLVSDTHGDVKGWEKAVQFLGEADLVLHAGDILYHGAFNPILPGYAPRELAELLNEYQIPLIFARGNCDSEVDQIALDYPILSEYTVAMVEDMLILVMHGHQREEKEIIDLATKWRVRVVVRGHTHIHSVEEKDGIVMVNPGSPSLPKGDEIPTVGLIDGHVVRIIDIDSGETIISREIA